ncbi:MAG: SDR family oxidoreductase [Spirochaetaceae bacterium]|nr:SDR family oxidoreductase [Spirochaetaceae bacterium]
MGNRLAGKIAIITGAGQGIGRAGALAFAAEGATVVVNDLHEETAQETTRRVHEAGGRALCHVADVTDSRAVDALVERCVAELGRLDVMWCNAGGARPESTVEMSDAAYERVVALNQHAVFYGCRAALRAMLPQRSGNLLITTSGAGLGAVHHLAAYGMAKAAVVNLGKSLAAEYGRHGIRANVISPGPMGSEGFLSWLATVEGLRERFESEVPLRRLGTPEDIARTAVFLASDEASFVSGVVVPVDGGIASQYPTPQAELPED